MTHEDEGHYASKHPTGTALNQAIAEQVRQYISNERITCADAHRIASDLNVHPSEVGRTFDLLEVRLTKCQLGLFGYGPRRSIITAAETVSSDLKSVINNALEDNRLSCADSWRIAEEFGITRMEIARALEALKVKITPCQLGAF